MTSIIVNYYFDDRSFHTMECHTSDTIGCFLSNFNKEKDDDDDKNLYSVLSVCLKGKIIPNEDKLEKYIDDLHYYAFFISTDPTKELQINKTPINLNDYQAQKNIGANSFKAINKKTNKKVLIQFFSRSYGSLGNGVKAVYMNHLFNSPYIPRYIGHYFSVDIDTLKKFDSNINDEFNNFYIIEDNLHEFNIQDVHNYNKSKGSNNTKMNPTKISKLIFGFASLIKKVHEKGITFCNMRRDMIQLDENDEPHITDFLSARFLTDRSDETSNHPFVLYLAPESIQDLEFPIPPSNVYSFAVFVYDLFNSAKFNFFKLGNERAPKVLSIYMKEIAKGNRPVKLNNIPDHYWELIEYCWDDNLDSRPSFNEIVEILKDDKYALTEFGVETNLDELHEYQNRIENMVNNDESKESLIRELEESKESLIREVEKLKKKIKKIEKKQKQSPSIYKLNILDSDMIQNLRIIKEISSGGSGKVLEVGKEEKFALKMMHTGNHSIEEFKGFIEEYEKLIRLKHPNIVEAYGIFMSDAKTPPSILLELCTNDLKTMINTKSYKGKSDIVIWIYQIVEGMKFVHKNGIVHRDLKPSNILIGKDGKIRISDFGIAKLMTTEEQSTTRGAGTQKFMAPEILREEKYNEKADVYSFGVLLYFILSGGEMPKINIIQIGNGVKAKIPDSFTKFAKDLINDCWNSHSKDRPSFEEILSRLEKQNYKVFEMDKSEVNEVLEFVKEHKKLIPEY